MSEQQAQNREAPEGNERHELMLRLALAYGAAAVAAVALLLYGYLDQNIGVMALGGLSIVLVLAVAPVSFIAAAGSSADPGVGVDLLVGEIRQLRRSVDRMNEYGVLSDDARRVLNRARERDLLVRAIEEDIAAEDWDAAIVLCDELAGRFGYREEAEQFRQRVEQARSATRDRNVAAAIAALDGLIVQRRWDHALNQAASIQRLYHDSTRVTGLRQRVENARERYKTDLERRFLHAAQSDTPDEAMELLRELDAYLTEAEGEPYRELARGIIGKARENLGASFKLAVRDRRWRDAAQLGERIIAEFPNTRMAEEVRTMIDGLRQRASSLSA